jgi:hypothetical protein
VKQFAAVAFALAPFLGLGLLVWSRARRSWAVPFRSPRAVHDETLAKEEASLGRLRTADHHLASEQKGLEDLME